MTICLLRDRGLRLQSGKIRKPNRETPEYSGDAARTAGIHCRREPGVDGCPARNLRALLAEIKCAAACMRASRLF